MFTTLSENLRDFITTDSREKNAVAAILVGFVLYLWVPTLAAGFEANRGPVDFLFAYGLASLAYAGLNRRTGLG